MSVPIDIDYYPEPDPPEWATSAGVTSGFVVFQHDGVVDEVIPATMITNGEGRAWIQVTGQQAE